MIVALTFALPPVVVLFALLYRAAPDSPYHDYRK